MSEDKHPQHIGQQFNNLMSSLKDVPDNVVDRATIPGESYQSAKVYHMTNMMQRYAQDDTLEAQGLATPSDAAYYAKHSKADQYGRKLEPKMGSNIKMDVTDSEGNDSEITSQSIKKGKHSGEDSYEFLSARDKQVQADYHADTDFSEYFKD
jgi:hypothetical protein